MADRGAFASGDPYDMTSPGMMGDVRPTYDDVESLALDTAYSAHPAVVARDLYGALSYGDWLTSGIIAAGVLPVGKAAIPGLRKVGRAFDDVADTFDLPFFSEGKAPAVIQPRSTPTLDDLIASQSRDDPLLDYGAFADVGRTLNAPGIEQGTESAMGAFRSKRNLNQPLKNLSHPAHLQRLRRLRDEGLVEGPGGAMMNPWYNPGPLSEKWNEVLGGPFSESDAALQKFMQATGPTSIQTNVSDNVREASLAYPYLLRGEPISNVTHGRSELTGAGYNEKLRKLQQIQSGNYDEAVGFPTTAHKIYNYTRNLQGEGVGVPYPNSPVTLDSQMAEVMRLRTKDGVPKERFVGPAYAVGEDIIRGLGDEVGAAGADVQAAIWQSYLASKHGGRAFGDRYSDTFARTLEDRVNKTADTLGEDRETIWKQLINGERGLLSLAPVAGGAAMVPWDEGGGEQF